MQLIDRSYSGSSYLQRTFPFGSSASDGHENTNEATELCTLLISMISLPILYLSFKFFLTVLCILTLGSLSEFARKLHAKT